MHFIKTNVAKEEDWEQLMENTLSKWGRVDILVNNAGTSYRNKVNHINPAAFRYPEN
jgi:NADP-dependent 3-hydroxy acid dehydrogenase YdfG